MLISQLHGEKYLYNNYNIALFFFSFLQFYFSSDISIDINVVKK